MALTATWRNSVRPVVERTMRGRGLPGVLIRSCTPRRVAEHLVIGADTEDRAKILELLPVDR